MTEPIRAFVAAMPKTELHLHLDGSVRVQTALELATTRGVDAPATAAGIRSLLVAPPICADQAELLRAFDLPIRLLQDAEALDRVAAELVEAKAADGVRYVEIRWGPRLHLAGGLPLDAGIAAVVRGANRAASAATAPGIAVRLICTAIRSHDPLDNVRLAEAAARFLDEGLTGFDLAGPEAAFPDPLLHRRAFEAARAGGLAITVHAGEWDGPDQVRRALELEPRRIAHGAPADQDASLVALLRERAVCLDLCPTSNVQTRSVASLADHPLARLHRAGVAVTLSTDDTTVSDLTLSEEYRRAIELIGLTPAELWAIDRRALDVAFADEATLAPIRLAFDAWAASEPLLRSSGDRPDPIQSPGTEART